MEAENEYQDPCEECDGTGFVPVEGRVWAHEPHTAPVDEAPCRCQCDDGADDWDSLIIDGLHAAGDSLEGDGEDD